MDTLTRYSEIVQKVITEYSTFGRYGYPVVRELIFDTVRDRYQLVNVGWQGERRVYGCVVHMDIINGKIWLQYNGTEVDFAEELIQHGVPSDDIVLGFLSPFMREYSDYAVE